MGETGRRRNIDFRKGDIYLSKQLFIHVEEVAQELNVSKAYAYKLVQKMNRELKEQGYLTIAGRTNRTYYEEKIYGRCEQQEEKGVDEHGGI